MRLHNGRRRAAFGKARDFRASASYIGGSLARSRLPRAALFASCEPPIGERKARGCYIVKRANQFAIERRKHPQQVESVSLKCLQGISPRPARNFRLQTSGLRTQNGS